MYRMKLDHDTLPCRSFQHRQMANFQLKNKRAYWFYIEKILHAPDVYIKLWSYQYIASLCHWCTCCPIWCASQTVLESLHPMWINITLEDIHFNFSNQRKKKQKTWFLINVGFLLFGTNLGFIFKKWVNLLAVNELNGIECIINGDDGQKRAENLILHNWIGLLYIY